MDVEFLKEMSKMQIVRPMNFAALGLGAAFTVVYGVADPMAAFAEIRTIEADGPDCPAVKGLEAAFGVEGKE